MTNPTAGIPISLSNYAHRMEAAAALHMNGDVTDYCFSVDQQIRRRLASIKLLEYVGQALVRVALEVQKSLMQMGAVAVGPRQYPRVHRIAEECAKRLGIGLPQVFVVMSPIPNAYTLASDQSGDMIVVHSCLVEATTDQELTFILGHECGHIHNQHGVYNTIAELLFDELLLNMMRNLPGGLLFHAALSFPARLLMSTWSRAAEVTCDRAGLICAGNLDVGRFALAKLLSGGGAKLRDVNLEELTRQLEQVSSTPIRITELFQSHPIIPRRLEALRLFSRSQTLLDWRPEMSGPEHAVSPEETDQLCEAVVRVVASNYKGWR